MKRVVISPRAERDLQWIVDGVEWRNRAAAERVIQTIERRIHDVGEHPEVGRMRRELGVGIRSLSAAPYVLLYRVVEERVEILRCIDGRRSLKEWL